MRGFIFLPRKVVKSVPSVRFLFVNPLCTVYGLTAGLYNQRELSGCTQQCMNNSTTQSSSLDVGYVMTLCVIERES